MHRWTEKTLAGQGITGAEELFKCNETWSAIKVTTEKKHRLTTLGILQRFQTKFPSAKEKGAKFYHTQKISNDSQTLSFINHRLICTNFVQLITVRSVATGKWLQWQSQVSDSRVGNRAWRSDRGSSGLFLCTKGWKGSSDLLSHHVTFKASELAGEQNQCSWKVSLFFSCPGRYFLLK